MDTSCTFFDAQDLGIDLEAAGFPDLAMAFNMDSDLNGNCSYFYFDQNSSLLLQSLISVVITLILVLKNSTSLYS